MSDLVGNHGDRFSRVAAQLFDDTFKLLAIVCGFTGRFLSDLVGNHGDRFSHVAAQTHSRISTPLLASFG